MPTDDSRDPTDRDGPEETRSNDAADSQQNPDVGNGVDRLYEQVRRPPDPDATVSHQFLAEVGAAAWSEQLSHLQKALGGRFEFHECVARREDRVVFRAFQRVLEREVAVKVVFHRDGGDAELFRLCTEAKRVARIKNVEQIVEVYDAGVECVGTNDAFAWYSMEWIDSPDLSSALTPQTRLPWQTAFRLMIDALNGLQNIQGAYGLCHNDIKPSNLFRVAEDKIKICDFGLAGFLFQGPDNGSFLGTLPYLPPEGWQIPQRLNTPYSENYMVGATLAALLSGRTPFAELAVSFDQASLHDHPLRQVHRDGRIAEILPGDLPAAVRDIVRKATDPDPTKRYQSVSEFRDVLKACLRRDAATSVAPALLPKTAGRPQRWLMAGAGGILVLLVLAFLYSGTNSSAPPPEYKARFVLWLCGQGDEMLKDRVPVGGPGTLPLRPGSQVYFEGKQTQGPPAHPYLIWIDSTGEPSLYFPEAWAATGRPPVPPKLKEVRLPRDKICGPLGQSPTGCEAILFLVRTTPLTKEDNLALNALLTQARKHWSRPSELPHSAIWLDNGFYAQDKDMGPLKKELARDGDHPYQQLEALMLAVKKQKLADCSYAIGYPFMNPKE